MVVRLGITRGTLLGKAKEDAALGGLKRSKVNVAAGSEGKSLKGLRLGSGSGRGQAGGDEESLDLHVEGC